MLLTSSCSGIIVLRCDGLGMVSVRGTAMALHGMGIVDTVDTLNPHPPWCNAYQ